MKVIVGLGNPGNEYEQTRHNIGFEMVEFLVRRFGAPTFSLKPQLHAEISKHPDYLFIKPQTFMNRSGQAVRAVLEYFTDWRPGVALDWLYVIHDDLDLPVGSSKLQLGTGPKQHNGLLSLYDHLGTKQFWHARVGVDGRGGDRSFPPDAYVLQRPTQQEDEMLERVVEELAHQIVTNH